MQSRILFLLFLSFNFCLLPSQVPQGFNYQAIATDAGSPIITPITVRFTIQSTEAGGETFWIEDHLAVTPNAQGLFTRVVGTGIKVTGSTAATFADIDWRVPPKWIKTEINYGGWKTMGATLLQSVPYSMVSQNLSGAIDRLVVAGKSTSLKDALFEVKNNNGQTIFAVYNEGVRVFIDNGLAKSPKGGFAIGSFGTDEKGKTETQRLLYVKTDTIRMYIDDVSKAPKGGFAIGGFGEAKSMTDNYLKVDIDKINAGKVDYLKFSSFNTFIGESAGSLNPINNATYNTFIGYKAGQNNTGSIATYNLFIGSEAGNGNTTGTNNVFVGLRSGYQVGANAHENVFIGKWSGYKTTGSNNIFIGNSSGLNNMAGNGNVFLGQSAGLMNNGGYLNLFLASNAGQENTSGYHNVYMGYAAGAANQTGNFNIAIGAQAGTQNTVSNNTMIGFQSGFSNLTGTDNIFLGYQAGFYETGSNRLYITNVKGTNLADGIAKALIYGEFDNKVVTINDVLKLTPRATAPTTPVNGMIYINSTDNHIYCRINNAWKQLD